MRHDIYRHRSDNTDVIHGIVCHSERSEESRAVRCEILRCAQDDTIALKAISTIQPRHYHIHRLLVAILMMAASFCTVAQNAVQSADTLNSQLSTLNTKRGKPLRCAENLAHYFRDTYDRNMAQLPTIMSGVVIEG